MKDKFKTIHENAVMINPPLNLDLSVRALNSIKQANIKSTEELFSLSTNDMIILGFGRKSILEINELKDKYSAKNFEEDYWIKQINNLDKYDAEICERMNLWENGIYVKLEDGLNLFSAKND